MKRGTKIAAVAGAAILLILLAIGIREIREQSTERNRKTFQEAFGFEPPERNNTEQIAKLQPEVDARITFLKTSLMKALFVKSNVEPAKKFCDDLQAKLPDMINAEIRETCAPSEQRFTEIVSAVEKLETALNKALAAAKYYGFKIVQPKQPEPPPPPLPKKSPRSADTPNNAHIGSPHGDPFIISFFALGLFLRPA